MRSKHLLRGGAAVWTAAFAIAAGACNTAERGAMNQDADQNANQNRQMTVTGCLQQGDGSDFILTEANELPERPIATSGEQAGQDVREEQRQAAMHSYRLDGGPDNLRDMVGNRVRVTGRVEGSTELRQRQQEGGQPREGEPRQGDLESGDLAEIHVASVERVAGTCGSGSPRNQ